MCVPEQETQAKPVGVSVSQEEGVQVSITQTVHLNEIILFWTVGGFILIYIFLRHKKEKKKDKEREKERDRERREDRDRSRDERERSSGKKNKDKERERERDREREREREGDRDRKSDSDKGDVKVGLKVCLFFLWAGGCRELLEIKAI